MFRRALRGGRLVLGEWLVDRNGGMILVRLYSSEVRSGGLAHCRSSSLPSMRASLVGIRVFAVEIS